MAALSGGSIVSHHNGRVYLLVAVSELNVSTQRHGSRWNSIGAGGTVATRGKYTVAVRLRLVRSMHLAMFTSGSGISGVSSLLQMHIQ